MKLTRLLHTMGSTISRQTTTKTEKINKYMVHIYDEATANSREPKPIVVLYAWLQAKEKHLERLFHIFSHQKF